MAVRPILTVPDPLLKQVSTPVEGVDAELHALLDDMLETMYAAPGIGLAAVQIGVPKRVIVMDLAREGEDKQPRFFINPEILWSSDDLVACEEGCLSIPEIYDEVERPAKVRIRYMNRAGETIEEECDELYSVCIQHEMDHLEGIVFIDHLSRLKRDRAVSKVKKLVRAA
ncbi:MAG: peptide deformylase [Alphaproteobacteria bacterium]